MAKLLTFSGTITIIGEDGAIVTNSAIPPVAMTFVSDSDTLYSINGDMKLFSDLSSGMSVVATYIEIDGDNALISLAATVSTPSTVLTEAVLRGYLYDWLVSVLPVIWTGQGGTRPVSRAEFVWHMETNSRPASPVLEGRIGNGSRIGRDTIGGAAADGTRRMTGDREFMLYLHWFGPGAMDNLNTIQNATQDPLLVLDLQAHHLAIREASNVIDAHQYLDTQSEDGATLDIRMGYSEYWTSAPGIIEHLESTGYDGAGNEIAEVNV